MLDIILICDYCKQEGADEFSYEGYSWTICKKCEEHQTLLAEAQADAYLEGGE